MKYDEEIKKGSEILEKFFSGLLGGKIEEYTAQEKGWKKVLMNIPIDGEKMAAHSVIKEIKNGYIYIETDHSGWVQLFQLHKNSILRSLKKEFSTLEIKNIVFTVKEPRKMV